ncbi:exodeoxyribonuclease V subunit gamma [Actinomycetospora cinnamomea]|uniref:RecBCD enzyme subunit RecC n=1 Tax=Actinomycetospora cinnamomea TaxID=663609 RepID=A0A2U1FGH8_9PSEU|nr:exodeoxyribonuclease V subunit gamma [Actinomycetospora cinnamomea]PVZ11070.1 DNA helicase/exodeoxyribonuclease V gamma subunit [Actinomycetospora cinnamomea]
MLHVHRAERADRLVEALADVLADPLDDPFEPEVVAVPTRGIERWLAQRLSHRLGVTAGDDGVCANVVFPSPAEIVAGVLDVGEHDPWRPERLVWPLLETIDACAEEPWCAPLGAFLGVGDASGARRGRRFAAARHLARLFTRYADHRPALVRAWAAGDDADTPEDLRWQPELWRRLRSRLTEPSPAEIEPRVEPGRFPARLSLFGATRLSSTELTVLGALAVDHDVHLWLPHPSPALWARLEGREAERRAEDASADAVAHPLLASLGRDVRELQLRLARSPRTDHHHAVAAPPTTLLARLQDDLRHDRAPAGVPAVDDGSIRVHRCHGPDRQVEVLRETILGLLRDDPTLEPRDVIVLCPDIETFAPLITASFGPGDGEEVAHPGHRLRVRLADRSLREVNPLFGTVATLLDLADARITASQLLDLAESDPVRRRFRFDDEDLQRLRELAGTAGVRWGLDAAHRAAFKLARFGENTWAQGLDRLLVGVAMSADGGDWLGDALPLDEVDSSDVEPVGRLGELVDRVGAIVEDLHGDRPLSGWIDALRRGLDTLTATVPADAWQLAQARAELAAVLESAPHDPPMTLHDVRAVLADRLAGRPTRANFRTGTLTVATLMPMRSVPHRVVCLLGMDDQVFPRETRADGDDVLARDPRVGERDPAAEDRQLLLDAIVAATDHLVVVHSGADERTGAERPPAVPIGELLDTLDASFAFADGRRARKHLTRLNPLQPFDADDFDARGPFSFDGFALAGTRALLAERGTPTPFLPGPLPSRPAGVVDLEDLARFLEHPVRAFLRQRLGIHARGEEEEPVEAVPVEPDGLATWAIGERLLRDRLAGRDIATCIAAERRRGELPPGPLGDRLIRDVGHQVDPLTRAVDGLRDTAATDVDVTSDALVGAVGGVHATTLVTVTYSRLAPKHRLRAWVSLLALAAAYPDRPWRAVTVGRGSFGAPVLTSTLGPLEPEVAQKVLADLLALHAEGLLEPLPLMCRTSEAYAQQRATKGEVAAMNKARDQWTSRFGGEQSDAAHVLVWGRRRVLDDLVGAPCGDAPSRFASLATRLWTPVREAEDLRR